MSVTPKHTAAGYECPECGGKDFQEAWLLVSRAEVQLACDQTGKLVASAYYDSSEVISDSVHESRIECASCLQQIDVDNITDGELS